MKCLIIIPQNVCLFMKEELFNNDIYNGHWLGDEVPLNWDPKIWHHILVTKQSNEFSFYIDGRLHSIEETQAQVISNIDAPLTIGRAEKNPINGDLDEIRIYDKAFCPIFVLLKGTLNPCFVFLVFSLHYKE